MNIQTILNNIYSSLDLLTFRSTYKSGCKNTFKTTSLKNGGVTRTKNRVKVYFKKVTLCLACSIHIR